MEATFIIIVLVCAAAAAIVGLLAAMQQKNRLKTELAVVNMQLESEKAQREKEKAESLSQIEAVKEESERRSKEALAEKDKYFEQAFRTQQEKFDETVTKMTAQVKTATEEMLKERQEEFAKSSNNNLGQLMNPLKETMEKMSKAISENTLKQTSISSEMKANMENMIRQNEASRKSAEELILAFRHKPKVQGDWGEAVLEELLTSQGLKEGVHFFTQTTMRDADGRTQKSEDDKMMRPDVLLCLDQKRVVVVDSKVSLTAFMNYVNADNEEDRAKYLKEHIASIRKHVKELAAKEYQNFVKPPKVQMNYVIMFVPHSEALWTALREDTGLWREAMNQNVYIADEQTLYAALSIINMTWTQILQEEKQQELYQCAQEMLDRVGLFAKSYQEIGKSLESVQKAYQSGWTKLREDGRSIGTSCRKMLKLGVQQGKNPLPAGMIDVDDIQALEDNTVLSDNDVVAEAAGTDNAE